MKEELVRLLGRGRSIIARDAYFDPARDDAGLDDFKPPQDVFGDHDCVCALALGDGEGDGGTPLELAIGEAGRRPGAMLGLGCADDDVRDILNVNRPAVARREQEQADIRDALQSLPGENGQRLAAVAERADEKRAIGVGQLVDQLIERHAIDRQAFGSGSTRIWFGLPPTYRRADVVDFDQLVLKLFRD